MRHLGMGMAGLTLVALVGLAGAALAMRDAPPTEPAKGDAAKAQDTTAAAKPPRDFSGKYLAEGMSSGRRKYKAMVEISREGEAYQVLWVLGPREAYIGVGLAEGDGLVVGWSTGQIPGVIVYKPDKEQLVGRWTAPGSEGKIFKETLTPVK